MGVLSKMKARKAEEKKEEKKSDEIPEISDVKKWFEEIERMSREGIKEIDEKYDLITSKVDSESSCVMNLALVFANYLSFRYNVYEKLAKHYKSYDRAFKEADSVLDSHDKEFISKIIGVMKRWMKEKKA